jgi:hypothetical protein
MCGKPPNLDDEFSSDKRAFCRWATYFSMPADLPSKASKSRKVVLRRHDAAAPLTDAGVTKSAA